MAAMRSIDRRWRSDRGSELIELAMVTPILMLMLAGIFDFGFLFRSWEIVTNAAREGARVGVLPAYSCDAATPDDIQSRVDAYMAASGIGDPSSYEVNVDNIDVATTAGTFTACAVTVELTQPLPSLSVIGQIFGGNFGTVPVAAAAVMRAETQAAPPAP
jgi:Flp pilus assembly protein TadG